MVYAANQNRWFSSVNRLNHSGMYQTFGGYLSHHGIKGQRWGIRRYQNEDGTLTEEGMRRYGILGSDGKYHVSDELRKDYTRDKAADNAYRPNLNAEKKQNKPISKRRQELIEGYKQKGLTQDQAEAAALRRERTEKIVKVAGAIALTAALAYGAYKGRQWLMKNGDRKIKAGATLFRTTNDPTAPLDRAGYVVDNAKDADKYVGKYGNQLKQQGALQRAFGYQNVKDDVYQLTGKAQGKIKVAGDRKANKVYQELLKNDKQFAADNNTIANRLEWRQAGLGGNSYKDFNTRLVDHEGPEAQRVQQKFYDALKKKGYGGVMDVNDRDYSGYHTSKPVILFNLKDHFTSSNVRDVSVSEIADKMKKADSYIAKQYMRDELLKEGSKTLRNIAGYGAVGAGLGALSLKSYDRKDSRRGAQYKTIIREYKREHPGTKLSDSEILENELG